MFQTFSGFPVGLTTNAKSISSVQEILEYWLIKELFSSSELCSGDNASLVN